MDDIQQRLDWAVAIAREAGDQTLKLFRSNDLGVEKKGDGSPVTEADRSAETLLRERIGERFPDDAILGEEFDDKPGTTGYRWVLDPIDGTKSFVHGVPLYTTLVAVLREEPNGISEPVLGVINAPAAGEMVYAGVGRGCWAKTGELQPRPAHVSTVSSLSESLLLTTDSGDFADGRSKDAGDVFLDLQRESRISRTWGDAYGFLMIALGRADAMVEPVVSLWDIAAIKPIIEEAGGRFTDWEGVATVHSGEAVATNGLLHESVLSRTRGR
ncbi:MAG: histidinol-phosphatase [Planctomycetota bacterium]